MNSPSNDRWWNIPNWKANHWKKREVFLLSVIAGDTAGAEEPAAHAVLHLVPAGTTAIPSLGLLHSQLPAWYSPTLSGMFLTRLSFCKGQELVTFYHCRKVTWPELLAWKSLLFKVKADGEPAGRKDQFYSMTLPSFVPCSNPFYYLWHPVIQISL